MVRHAIPHGKDPAHSVNNTELAIRSPQPVTRGLHPDFFCEDCIDWLSLTFPSLDDVVYPDWWDTRAIDGRGMQGYTRSRRYADGRLELYHPDRPEMGVHVIMAGRALQNVAGVGVTELQIFRRAGATFRRVDLARDIFNSPLSFGILAAHIRKGKAVTKARQFPAYTSDKGQVKTQYVGRKTSDCYVRIYDKAFEQGIEGTWHRIEVVFQDDKAAPAVRAFCAGESVVSLLKSVIDFPAYRKWGAVLSSEAAARITVGRVNGDTERWLLQSVAPSMARVLFQQQDDNFLVEWLTKVRMLKEALEEKAEPFQLA